MHIEYINSCLHLRYDLIYENKQWHNKWTTDKNCAANKST